MEVLVVVIREAAPVAVYLRITQIVKKVCYTPMETTLRIPADVPPAMVQLCKVAPDLPALPVMVLSGAKAHPVVVTLAVVAERLMGKLYLPPTVLHVMVQPVQASTTKQPVVSPQPLATSAA